MEKEEKKETTIIGDDRAQSISVAKEFLANLGRKSTPESARSLLIGAGVWDIHTNLDVIRLRIPTTFGSDLEQLASDHGGRVYAELAVACAALVCHERVRQGHS